MNRGGLRVEGVKNRTLWLLGLEKGRRRSGTEEKWNDVVMYEMFRRGYRVEDVHVRKLWLLARKNKEWEKIICVYEFGL